MMHIPRPHWEYRERVAKSWGGVTQSRDRAAKSTGQFLYIEETGYGIERTSSQFQGTCY